MPPKKAPGITVILIDAGPNMAKRDEENGKNDFEKAINAADWIISRKLFSEDTERFVVMAYNLDPSDHSMKMKKSKLSGASTLSTEFSPASFEHLRFITKEVEMNRSVNEPNLMKSVVAAASLLNSESTATNASGVTLILLTNGMDENLRQEQFDLMEESITGSGADLMVIGISEQPEFPASRIIELVDTVGGTSYTFEKVSKMLSNYQAKQTAGRNYNKMWDIAPGIRLSITMALKSEKKSSLLKFKNADSEGNQMVRMDQMHVEVTQNTQKTTTSSMPSTQNTQTVSSSSKKADPNEFVDDDDVKPTKTELMSMTVNDKVYKPVANVKAMHGYNFGKSLILMDPEYLKEKYNDHNFNEGQTGGVLKLIQFTKRANILESYLLDSSARTVLPSLNSCTTATVSLIEAMLSLRVAAICRYTFHAKSHVQLIALLPHRDEETGVAYLRSVRLPFSDDMRSLKFPKFSEEEEETGDETKPSLAQLSAVDDLIDSMQLKEGEIANLVEGGLSDPKLQMQCGFLKSFVLNPDDTLDAHETRTNQILNDIIAPKRRVEAENPEIFEKLGREFNLEPILKTKRRRVEVEAADLQNMIEEWTKKRETVEETVAEKKPMKKKKVSRREELQTEVTTEEGRAEVCKKMLQMIQNTCGFNGATSFFALVLQELKTIRDVFVEHEKCDEFNELLRKVKEEEDFEPFAEYLAEEKTCNPIDKSEVETSDVSEEVAAEYWEEA